MNPLNLIDYMNIALVTGAANGLGKAYAIELAKSGYHTLLLDLPQTGLESLCNKIVNEFGTQSVFYEIDLTQTKQIIEVCQKINEQYEVSILINNAGITGSTSSLWDYDVDEWNKIVQINLMGTFNCCKCVVPNMIKNNYGRIINVASVAGKDGNANASAYSSAKAGAIGLTKSLGKELADKNIAVNAVTPAGAKTRILDQMSKEHVARMLSKVPRGRFLEIEEFTSLICWLASEENSFSTAAVFDISGGRSTY